MAVNFGDGANTAVLDGVALLNSQYDNNPEMAGLMGQRPTPSNLTAVGNPIINNGISYNAWCTDLINRIVEVILENPDWVNPLAMFQTDMNPFGTDIQEIHVNRAKANTFVPCDNAELLLKCCPVDVAAVLHRLNREEQYCASVLQTEAEKAFTDAGNMNKLVNGISQSLFNGNEIDEWNYTVRTMGGPVSEGKTGVINTPLVTDEVSGKGMTEFLKLLSYYMTVPSTKYNNYIRMNGGRPDRWTWTPRNRQIIVMRADVYFKLSVQVLASAFNMSQVELDQRIVLVPEFVDHDGAPIDDMMAMIMDLTYLKIKNKQMLVSDFFNPQGWTYKYILTPRQLYSVSPFANATAIIGNSLVTDWPSTPTEMTPVVYTP